jgi:hypothetical protein
VPNDLCADLDKFLLQCRRTIRGSLRFADAGTGQFSHGAIFLPRHLFSNPFAQRARKPTFSPDSPQRLRAETALMPSDIRFRDFRYSAALHNCGKLASADATPATAPYARVAIRFAEEPASAHGIRQARFQIGVPFFSKSPFAPAHDKMRLPVAYADTRADVGLARARRTLNREHASI